MRLTSRAPVRRPLGRTLLAVLLPAIAASFVGSLILSLTVLSDLATPTRIDPHESFAISLADLVIIGTILGSIWGQIAMFGLFLPAHVWIKRNTTRPAWIYACAGVVAGLVFGAIFGWMILFGRTMPSLHDFAWPMVASAAGGVVAGLAFWVIRRPDRDGVSSTPPA